MNDDKVTGWSVLIAASLLFAFAKYIIIAILVALTIWCLNRAITLHAENKSQREVKSEIRRRELLWRANEQNAAQLRGHPYGTYGEYMPVEVDFPQPREWYDYE